MDSAHMQLRVDYRVTEVGLQSFGLATQVKKVRSSIAEATFGFC